MESSSDPPKRPPDGGGGNNNGDDDDDRKPPPDADNSMTEVERTNALKSHRIRYEDAVDPNAERVTEIQPHDVILGRGKRLQELEGNVRMRRIAKKYSTHYHSLKPSEKTALIETVYQEVVQDGARFLIKAPDAEDTYLVVDEEIALQKVSNILRRKKPFVEPTFGSVARIGEGTGLDPAIQQAMNAGRSHIGGAINPGVASLPNHQQLASLGNEVARLPTNPLLPSLNPLASLPYASMYGHLPNLATNPSEQMRMTLMASMMERERMVQNALAIQQLNAIQESHRAAAFYSQAQNRNVAYAPLANNIVPLASLQQQSAPNDDEAKENEAKDVKSEDEG